MQEVIDGLRGLQVVVFVGLAVAGLATYRRRQSEAAGWLAVAFGLLAVVVVAGRLLPPASESWLVFQVRKLTVALLVLFPWTLYRFMRTLLPPLWKLNWIATGLTTVAVAWALLLPELPAQGEPRSAAFQAYVLFIAVQWTTLTAIVAARLWAAGRRQPLVARKRMRLLAMGSVAVNVALLLAAASGSSPREGVQLAGTLFALVSAPLFYVGFDPPGILRSAWRRPLTGALRQTELDLVAATTPDEIGDALLPFIGHAFGGQGALLADARGDLVLTEGLSDRDGRAVVAALKRGPPLPDDLVAVPLRTGWMAVRTGPATPFFGEDEIELLGVMGAFVDLALDRSELFEKERAAREEVERASEELEALVYGLSHDLKSPVATVLGYVDLLSVEYGDRLDAEGREFLDRMQMAGQYMRDLLNDLLELSRIGRADTEAGRVDLSKLGHDLAAAVRRDHPQATVVVGDLPTVDMNPVRARQLFTNLVENAVTHGGREDITVELDAERVPDGVRITVRDNGRGVPAQYGERIFDLFERLDRSSPGTGVGLSMCRKIVESAGGGIDLLEADDGAQFEINLPGSVVVSEAGDASQEEP